MSFCARVPSNVSSSTSVSLVKRSYGNQNPWSTIAEKEERPGRPDIGIVLAEQSDPLFEPATILIMTPRPSIEIPAQEILLQKRKERVERLPQQD